MDDVHHVGKIQRAIHALGPTAVAAEEFPGAWVAEQSFHRLFKIHAYNLPNFEEIPNGVYPVSSWTLWRNIEHRTLTSNFGVFGVGMTCHYTVPPGFVRFSALMALDDILLEAEEKMEKTEQVVMNEFAGVRTGKASASLVENIMVEVYGSNMRIRELAGITTPEPRTLSIQPWDVNSLHAIEKAIQKSNLGLTPAIQGKNIRLFFPELSQERRVEFTKIIKKMAEDGKVAIRHVRRDAMDQIKKHAHDSGTTEDEVKQAEKDLQKFTDDYSAKIETHVVAKEKEIMTV